MSVPDNLLTNLDKVAYNTYFDAEKVVKTFTGSFLYSTGTTTRSYTLAGLPYNVQVFKIIHGFTRPVFVELLWSVDNVDFAVGGSGGDATGNTAIAYSDSTFIYIMNSALTAGTTVYYKIICTWINDYDTTNPSIAAFAEIPESYTQVFNSRSIIPSVIKQGTVISSTSSGAMTDVFSEVVHDLGYAPDVRVYIESFSGEVWPLNHSGVSNPYLVDDSQVEAQVFLTTTKLITDVLTKSANGSRKLWYMIYADSGVDVSTGGYDFFVI